MQTNKDFNDEEDELIDLTKVDLPILNRFFQDFPPAGSFKSASQTFTTNEIQANIGEHTGQFLPIKSLYNWLIDRGYKFESLGEGKFVWLIGEAIVL